MANTYQLIEAKTLGSTVTSVTFSSIPQTYTDLKLVFSTRTNASAVLVNTQVTFNGSSCGTDYTERLLSGDGSSASSTNIGARADWLFIYSNGGTSTSNTFANAEIYIPNYTSTTTYKSGSADGVVENNATSSIAALDAPLYSSNSAITSIKLDTGNATVFEVYSTFYLYGIKNS